MLEVDICRDVKVVLGGVAPVPWRARAAGDALTCKAIGTATVEAAAKAAVTEAKPLAMNAFKVPLAQALLKRAILAPL